MINPSVLDQWFHKFMDNLHKEAPDGILSIDLHFLHTAGLLQVQNINAREIENTLNHYFHVIESPERITLFNQDYVIWIVPQYSEEISMSHTLIALNRNEDDISLEVVFTTRGVYNTSHYIISIIEHFINEINENEKFISKLENAQ